MLLRPAFVIIDYELDILNYLLKPISFGRFYRSAIKAKEFIDLKSENKFASTDDYFFIKCDQKTEKILISDVVYAEGMANYIIIHTLQKNTLLM
jgi:DNA-binding LytR/AlgR family response regulator